MSNDTITILDSATYAEGNIACGAKKLTIQGDVGQLPVMDGTSTFTHCFSNIGAGTVLRRLKIKRYPASAGNSTDGVIWCNVRKVSAYNVQFEDCTGAMFNWPGDGTAGAESEFFYCTMKNGGMFFHSGPGNNDFIRVRNCLLESDVDNVINLFGSNQSTTIEHCTLIVGGISARGVSASNILVRNCIAYHRGGSTNRGYSVSASGLIEFCCANNFSTAFFGGQGSGNITTNPLFVNTATDDFHLQTGSPCENTGKDLTGIVTDDLDLFARPCGGGYDMGCYEYGCASGPAVVSNPWNNQNFFDSNFVMNDVKNANAQMTFIGTTDNRAFQAPFFAQIKGSMTLRGRTRAYIVTSGTNPDSIK